MCLDKISIDVSTAAFIIVHGEFKMTEVIIWLLALVCVCVSLGLYQWSEAVIRRVSRLWDIRGGDMVRHQVHVLVTPRVVVRITLNILILFIWREISSSMKQNCQNIQLPTCDDFLLFFVTCDSKLTLEENNNLSNCSSVWLGDLLTFLQ